MSNTSNSTVHVTPQALKNAFDKHLKVIEGVSEHCQKQGSYMLLLCYAVECGLKYQYLSRNNYKSTADQSFVHDLRKVLEQLGASKSLLGKLRSLDCREPKRAVSPSRYHEAFRYGAVTEPRSLREVHEGLMDVVRWLKGARP